LQLEAQRTGDGDRLHVFTFFNVFHFPDFFYLKKMLAKFRAASRLTRSTFKITATKKTYDFSVACQMT